MLFADRGLGISQEAISDGISSLPVDGRDLAKRLNELAPLRWMGGGLLTLHEPDWELILRLNRFHGTWAALLEPHGPRHVGHRVVVDGMTDVGVVLVRDPAGAAYGIPFEEFVSLWRYTTVVVEEVS